MQAKIINPNIRFEGTLVRSHYRPGQAYVQLVFKNKRTTVTALSRDAQKVVSLDIGATYIISGPEYALGSKTYVFEPSVRAVNKPAYNKKVLLSAGIASFVLISTAGVFAAKQFTGSSDGPEARTSSQETQTVIPSSESSTPKKSEATPTDQPPAPTANSDASNSTGQGVLSAPRTLRNYNPYTPGSSTENQNTIAPTTPSGDSNQTQTPADSTIDPAVPDKPTDEENPGEVLGAQSPPPPPPPPPAEPAVVDPPAQPPVE